MNNRAAAMQRNRAENAALMAQHQQVFEGLIAAGFRAVKVNAPLFEKQESGQWAVVGCSCGKSDCDSIGKHPVGNGWQNHSTNDWAVARQWLSEGYNLGAYVPPTIRAMAVDADRDDVLAQIFPDGIPATMGDEIAGKGHLMFTIPDGIDIDTVPRVFDGGEISVSGSRHLVAPLGLHPRGRRKWNGITAIVPIPIDALTRLQQSKRHTDERHQQAKGPSDEGWAITKGGRHPWMTTQAATLRNLLPSEDSLLAALRALNEDRCKPPISDSDVVRLAKYFWNEKDGPSAPGAPPSITLVDDSPPIARRLAIKSLSSFTLRAVTWLWHGWIAREEPILIEGESGLGKSTFVMDVIARLTTGREMPDGSPHPTGKPMAVLYITTEDDPERVVLARAMAAKADPTMIHFVTGEFAMPDDADALLATIRDYPDIGLVFIDPLFSHIGVDKNGRPLSTNADTEMRQFIVGPLRDICRATGVAILMARHVNKNTKQDISMRGSGSYGGLFAACRGVILVSKDPKDENRRLKVVGPLKSQYSALPVARRFETWSATVSDAEGLHYETSIALWREGHADTDIETYLMDSETATVKRQDRWAALDALIRAALERGCVPTARLKGMAMNAGYAANAVRDSRERVGVVPHQHGPSDHQSRLSSVPCSKFAPRDDDEEDDDESLEDPKVAPARRATTPPTASSAVQQEPEVCLCGAPKTMLGGCSDPQRHREWASTTDYGQKTRVG